MKVVVVVVVVVDSAVAVGDVAVVEGVVADGRWAVADAVEDEIDPKDPEEEGQGVEDLGKDMGLNVLAAVDG